MLSLQAMRDMKRFRWPATILLAVVIVSFIVFYGWNTSSFQKERDPKFAKILREGGNPLSFDKYTEIGMPLLQRAEDRLIQQKALLLPREIQQFLTGARMRDLISLDEKRMEAANILLIERSARGMGVEVTREDVLDLLRKQPGVTNASLAAEAKRREMSPQQYVDYMREELVADHAMALVRQVAHASLFELWQEYVLNYELVGLSLAVYPLADFEDQVIVTEDDLIAHLAENKEAFRAPQRRQYAYVKIDKERLRAQIDASEDQLRVHYEKNQTDYRELAGVRAEELIVPLGLDTPATFTAAVLDVFGQARERAAADDDWTTLALRLREAHPDMRFIAYTTNWLTVESRQRSPEYLKMLRSLADDGISTPMVDNARVVMVRVKERRADGVQAFETVVDRVREDYLRGQVETQFAETSAKWREAANTLRDKWKEEDRSSDRIEEFAAAVAVQDELSTPVAADSLAIPGVGNLAIARDYLASLKAGVMTDPIAFGDSVAVLQIRETTDAYDPPLAEIRADVEEALRRIRADELARVAADRNLQLVRGGADFTTILNEAPDSIPAAAPMVRTDPVQGLGAPLIRFREQAAGLKVEDTGLSPYGYNPEEPLGYAVWKVVSMEEPARARFADERYQFEREYLQLQQIIVSKEWLADRRVQAQYEPIEPKR